MSPAAEGSGRRRALDLRQAELPQRERARRSRHFAQRFTRRGGSVLLVALLGCAREPARESAACGEALRQARVLAKDADLQGAHRQLELAEQHCPERKRAYVEQLRDELKAKAARLREAQARQPPAEEQPLAELLRWVRERREAANKAEGETLCYPRDHTEAGWCASTRRGRTGVELVTRYSATDAEVFRFSAELPLVVRCEDLGAARVLRTWTVVEADKEVNRTHCELLDKHFRDLIALVSVTGEKTRVEVFSQGFADKDLAMRRRLEREGR